MATFDVLLPVKNGIAYFAEAVDSICNQTFQDWRLIILDHGSTDGSFELASAYAARDNRVVVKSFPEAKGLSGLLNCGLDLCDCQYVLRQDADDVSMPNRMEVIANAFTHDEQLVLVGSIGDIIDGTGNKIGKLDMPADEHSLRALTIFKTPMMHPTVAMRLSVIRKLGVRYGFDFIKALPESERIEVPNLAEDYFLFGQLALICKCQNIQQDLIQYRWHGANISALKYVEQMNVALKISRNFVQTLSLMHGTKPFDPAPFCNHGETLIKLPEKVNFSNEYQQLSVLLSKLLPSSIALTRELDYRRVLSHRFRPIMLFRYILFVIKYDWLLGEWRTIRSWMVGIIKRRKFLTTSARSL